MVDDPLTDEQRATIDRRAAELEEDPSIGIPEAEFMARLRAKWA
jgi:putative addiction module component (TIGR02574 family)